MGGMMEPQQVRVDPMHQSMQPLRGMLANQMQNRLGGQTPQYSQNPYGFDTPNPMQQLYDQPAAGGQGFPFGGGGQQPGMGAGSSRMEGAPPQLTGPMGGGQPSMGGGMQQPLMGSPPGGGGLASLIPSMQPGGGQPGMGGGGLPSGPPQGLASLIPSMQPGGGEPVPGPSTQPQAGGPQMFQGGMANMMAPGGGPPTGGGGGGPYNAIPQGMENPNKKPRAPLKNDPMGTVVQDMDKFAAEAFKKTAAARARGDLPSVGGGPPTGGGGPSTAAEALGGLSSGVTYGYENNYGDPGGPLKRGGGQPGGGGLPGGTVSPNAFGNNFNPQYQNQATATGGPAQGGGMAAGMRANATGRGQPQNPGQQGPGGAMPGQGIGNFDQTQWGGPYSAGLTPLQNQALGGAMNIGMNNPFVSDQMIQQGLQQGMGGNPIFDPSQGNIGEAMQPFQTPSQADPFLKNLMAGSGQDFFKGQGMDLVGTGDGVTGTGDSGEGAGSAEWTNKFLEKMQPQLEQSFGAALSPRTPPTGTAQGMFDEALDRAAAVAKEEASGAGLNAGAADRAGIIGRHTADIAAKLGPQAQMADTQAIGQMQNARNQALSAAGALPSFLNTGFQNKLAQGQLELGEQKNQLGQQQNLLGYLGQQGGAVGDILNREDRGFERMMGVMEPAAQRSMQTLGMLPEFRGMPMNEMMQMFGMGEAARGVADTDIQRRMQEFARTQGGGLEQALGLMGTVPGMQTGFGPSTTSQIGQVLQGVGEIVPW